MNTKTSALVFAIVMVFSSFVGCIDTEEEETNTATSPSSLGNVMVSTYHVAELVRAVGGDRVTVEIISPSNVPVHDYEPSAADLIRLQDVDLFFYHGLNLEPWVDSTISSLGDDAPLAVQTHAMPSGENTLDYQSMLLNNICEALNDDAFEAVTLADHHDEAGDVEIHAEAMTHKVSYPEMDDDHDDHGDDHDDHGDDDHGDDHDDHGDDHDDHGDDHDDHAEHNHAMAEKVISNPANCPADTVVSVFHLEEGEYLLEFEYGAATEFDMVVLKMMGGHAHHHHHGHGSGPYEWAGIFSISDSAHTWTMEKKDGSYADPSMKVVIIPTDTPTEATMHSLEEDAETLIEGDSCVDVQDGGTMTPIAPEGSCFNLVVDETADMSSFNMDTTGMTGFAAFTAHSPYEFENTQHYLKDSAGDDVEHVAEEGGGHDDHGHDDHGDDHDDHGDDHDDHGDDHDDHGDDHHQEMTDLMAIFNNSDANGDGFLNLTELEHFIPAVGEYDEDDHDDHDDDHDDHDDNDGHDDDHDDDHDGNETHDDDEMTTTMAMKRR